MSHTNTRHPDSSARASARVFTLALIGAAMIAGGVWIQSQDAHAQAPAPHTFRLAPAPAARTAGLLVPKRVRLIINYSRTALA